MRRLDRIVAFLDRELKHDAFKDSSNNGLQVQNSGRVRKICCGVDASLEFFEEAARLKADLLICHHGLSWDDSLKRITGLNYRKLAFLMKHDMALYASHLPLDAHPVHGNNAQLCRTLGLRQVKPFGVYHGQTIGFEGRLPKAMSMEGFLGLVRSRVAADLKVMEFGKTSVRSVAVVSGGGSGEIDEAGRKGIDVFLSGEPTLMAYNLAREYAMHVVFAGHYATEVFGVRALGTLLTKKFGVKAEFLDLSVPF